MTSYKLHPLPIKPVIGYTTRRHLLLDLDNTTLTKVEIIARAIMRQWPKVGDCLIMESSAKPLKLLVIYKPLHHPEHKIVANNYHLIFDNQIGYNLCCKIINTLAGLGILNKDYEKIREFRGDMTLRISPVTLSDGEKPAPIPRTYLKNSACARRDGRILLYLKLWKLASLSLQQGNRNCQTLQDTGHNIAA